MGSESCVGWSIVGIGEPRVFVGWEEGIEEQAMAHEELGADFGAVFRGGEPRRLGAEVGVGAVESGFAGGALTGFLIAIDDDHFRWGGVPPAIDEGRQ